MLRVFVEVIAAVFAVFGFYSFVKLIAYKLFGSDNVVLSILVSNQKEAELIEESVREAVVGVLSMKSCRIAILVCEEFKDDPRITETALRYGADRYVISEIK